MPRHIIIKLLNTNNKEKILKACRVIMIKMTGLLIRNREARRKWNNLFKALKKNKNKSHPKILCPVEISSGNKSEVKIFSD